MMKKKDNIPYNYLIALCFLGLALLTSCATEEVFSSQTPIILRASSEQAITRSDADIQSTTFDEGEHIRVYITKSSDGSSVASPRYTAEEAVGGINELTPDVQPYYPSGDVQLDILALYPYTVTKDDNQFVVQYTQTDNAQYKASDLMQASVSNQSKIDHAINLTFTHKMAKFIINASGDEGVVITGITLNNVYRGVAFTPSTGEVSGSSLSDQGNITMSNNGAALLPPQTISGNFITVSTNFGDANFEVTSKKFEGGNEYTMNMVVSRQSIGITSTITDWDTDRGTIAIVTKVSGGLEMADIANVEYDGTYHTPTPTVTNNNTTLTKDEDYTLQYFANHDVGTATVVAIGKKNETASRDLTGQAAIKTFIITQATGALSYPSNSVEVTYAPNAVVNNVLSKTGDGTMTYTSSDASVAKIDPVSGEVTMKGIGSTTITAIMAGDRNYTGAEASYSLQVRKKQVSSLTITLSGTSFVYTGNYITPTVTVKDGDTQLEPETDYSVTFSNNQNVGTATATITGYGLYEGTVDKPFTITKATTVITMEHTNITINSGSVIVRQGTTNYGTITYTSSNPNVASVGTSGSVMGVASGTATITASVAGSDNYTDATVSYVVTVMSMETIFDYTGTIQTWTVPTAGTYKLEVWGAKGGDYKSRRSYSGGYGGYATGTVTLTAGQTLYIVVGGEGGTSSSASGGTAGYNGGGAGGSGSGSSWFGSSQYGGGGGGGATHIAKAIGLLSTLTDANILIVAGGGGGASNGAKGGTGGGTEGSQGIGSGSTVAAGTQSSGNAKGQGATGPNNSYGAGSGGGGGGYYGGYANSGNGYGSGAGGSGYTGGVSNGSMQNGTRKGSGYVKITYQP